LASTVTCVTGHEDPTKPGTQLEWPKLASASGTLVFMMGMKNLPSIVGQLLSEGRPSDQPVAAIRWGTKSNQQTIVGTLGDIVAKAEAAHLEPPTVIVVGEVVRLREQLNWFETKPLFGKRIVLTRAQEQAKEFSQLLATYGAEPVEVPTIQIVPPASWQAMDDAVTRLSAYQWVIFTSVNGGEALHGSAPCCRKRCAHIGKHSPLCNWTENCAGTGKLWAHTRCRASRVSGRGCDRLIGPCGSPWEPRIDSTGRSRSRNLTGTVA
jgi:uroporphyrinogen III methyltransferase/synthase